MPGFPIRTSSDQRFIDNSPRLNAALHVLHRLSMPRHPPCALNNEHTTNTTTTTTKAAVIRAGVNTQNTKEQRNHTNHTQRHHTQSEATRMRLNARVHYTVLTQHPTPTNNHESLITTAAPRAGYNQGTMPQTPNNAPSTHPYAINACVLVNPSPWLRCISTRLTHGGSKTIVHSTTNHTTHTNACIA